MDGTEVNVAEVDGVEVDGTEVDGAEVDGAKTAPTHIDLGRLTVKIIQWVVSCR